MLRPLKIREFRHLNIHFEIYRHFHVHVKKSEKFLSNKHFSSESVCRVPEWLIFKPHLTRNRFATTYTLPSSKVESVEHKGQMCNVQSGERILLLWWTQLVLDANKPVCARFPIDYIVFFKSHSLAPKHIKMKKAPHIIMALNVSYGPTTQQIITFIYYIFLLQLLILLWICWILFCQKKNDNFFAAFKRQCWRVMKKSKTV